MGLESYRESGDATTIPLRRRPLWSRVSGAHLLALLAAIVAFVLNLALLRDPATLTVAVAATDLRVGSTLSEGSVRWIEISDATVGASLLTREHLLGSDLVVRSELLGGDPILRSAVGPPAAPSGHRAFTIEVERTRAGGGSIAVGDVVDVISTVDGVATYVAVGAEVLSVPESEQRGLTSGGYFVTVAIDAETALSLAEALDRGRVDVVLATGAPPPPAVTSDDGEQ